MATHSIKPWAVAAVFATVLLAGATARAGEVTVAVATNFLNPLKPLATTFQKQHGHTVRIVSGSTGKLYAQIIHGAPFDVFLAADRARPRLLGTKSIQKALPGTRFTYARGQLVLWSANSQLLTDDGVAVLRRKNFNHLALANPNTAPYGQAAWMVLQRLGLEKALAPLIVQGENIGQTFQFVATGNAEIGFVALSQVLDPRLKIKGSRWDVPERWHDPIDQDAILLTHGENNPAAVAFLEFLRSDSTRATIQSFGYGVKPLQD